MRRTLGVWPSHLVESPMALTCAPTHTLTLLDCPPRARNRVGSPTARGRRARWTWHTWEWLAMRLAWWCRHIRPAQHQHQHQHRQDLETKPSGGEPRKRPEPPPWLSTCIYISSSARPGILILCLPCAPTHLLRLRLRLHSSSLSVGQVIPSSRSISSHSFPGL